MLRFPLRLTADLALARIARKLPGDAANSYVLLLPPMEKVSTPALDATKHSLAPVAGTELLARVRNSSAPVVWIGGDEPLLHPEMGQLARCIAGIGRYVFLETAGNMLRRRIHEFRPVSNLFLAIQLNGLESSHDLRAGRAGAFQAALEGLRAARLSGFLICVHARVHAETEQSEIAGLIQFARSLDVDGFVITSASTQAISGNSDAEGLQRKTEEARALIGSRWWKFFSRLVAPVVSGERHAAHNLNEAGVRLPQEAHANEEGVRVA